MELWTDMMDKGLDWDCIYLDFSKAFDRVPHIRLQMKLEACGISGKVLDWLSSFLSNRRQSVALGSNHSEWQNVTSGIPQGSVLGPLLFVVFINDLPDQVQSFTKLFADDTKVFRAITSIEDHQILQNDLHKLVQWSEIWQLPFNIEKCKVIHHSKNNPEADYMMADTNVTTDTVEKDLGVTFDCSLQFSTHIRNITAKANSRVGLLKNCFSCMDKENFLPLYRSQVRPLLEYCSSIWNPILKRDVLEIEKVQHRATKLVPSLSELPYPERLKALNLKTLAFRRKRTDIIQVFRIIRGIDNLDFGNFFKENINITRGHRLKLAKPRVATRMRQHSFSQRIINLWNSLPHYAVEAKTINSFKNAINKAWANDPLQYDIPIDYNPLLL